MKLKFYFPVLIISILSSCKQSPKQQFTWLEGNWVQTNAEAGFHEQWMRINDTLLTGQGFVVEVTDTLFSERLTLETIGENTIYRVEMITGRIADFKLTEQTADKLVFELPENDFPSKIIYTKKSENELVVLLEGTDNSEPMQEELLFKRVK